MLFRKKFKTILYKIGQLTMIYNVIGNNKMPMNHDTIILVNDIGRIEEVLEGIQYQDMYQELTSYDLYSKQDSRDDNNSHQSNNICRYKDTSEIEEDVRKPNYDIDIDDGKLF